MKATNKFADNIRATNSQAYFLFFIKKRVAFWMIPVNFSSRPNVFIANLLMEIKPEISSHFTQITIASTIQSNKNIDKKIILVKLND